MGIELLRALFPDGEDKLPRLKKEDDQAWALNGFALFYARSGRPRGAVSLYKMSNKIEERRGYKKGLAIGLDNLAISQFLIGELDNAESNLMRSIEICREIKDERDEAISYEELIRLLAYRGNFEGSKKEFGKSLKLFTKLNHLQHQDIIFAYLSKCFLLISNADEALNSAKKSRELSDIKHYERDIIRAEWLLGAAHLMKGNLIEVEKHLTEALIHDRKINLVELEPDILLEFAKLRFKQNHKKEALKFAEEALQIADRCEYRLKQADIHNFLAVFYRDAGDLEKAREHGEIAKERAECGYKPALEKAKKVLDEIERG